MTSTYTFSLTSTSVGIGSAGGGIFTSRTAEGSSSDSSAAFLEKRILMLELLRELLSAAAALESAPLRRSTLSSAS